MPTNRRSLSGATRFGQGNDCGVPHSDEQSSLAAGVSGMRKTHIQQTTDSGYPLFARFLDVSTNIVKSWNQGDQAAFKLLTFAKKHPQAVLCA
jgi:DNA-binding transcriptional regulator YiaG